MVVEANLDRQDGVESKFSYDVTQEVEDFEIGRSVQGGPVGQIQVRHQVLQRLGALAVPQICVPAETRKNLI